MPGGNILNSLQAAQITYKGDLNFGQMSLRATPPDQVEKPCVPLRFSLHRGHLLQKPNR